MLSSKQRGLTLVELMVVVAVMAIIATVAYPMYTAQVQKTRRADAKIALESIAMAEERYYTVNGEYAVTLSSLQVSAAVQSGDSDEGYYAVALTQTDPVAKQDFTATATGTGRQAGDTDCASFTINQQGVKTATGGGTNCW